MASPTEGYALHAYGPERYLRHAVASAYTLRRHDEHRPVALYCTEEHRSVLNRYDLGRLFERVEILPETHRSILGFKHHLDRFMPYERTLWPDSDIIWCRDPNPLWADLAAYGFTSTGDHHADIWFGGPKDARVVIDLALRRRHRTLRRFGLTYLPRVLSALVYAQDHDLTASVCAAARSYFARRDETHFTSRLRESGRGLESCEWSLALAMSAQALSVYPLFQGADSPIVDFYPHTTEHDPDFEHVRYTLWSDRFLHDAQGAPNESLRDALVATAGRLPGRGERIVMTPFALHFGRLPYKPHFDAFVERTWACLVD